MNHDPIPDSEEGRDGHHDARGGERVTDDAGRFCLGKEPCELPSRAEQSRRTPAGLVTQSQPFRSGCAGVAPYANVLTWDPSSGEGRFEGASVHLAAALGASDVEELTDVIEPRRDISR